MSRLAKRGAPKSSPAVGRPVAASGRSRATWSPLHLARAETARAHLHLDDLAVLGDDTGDLEVRLPDAPRLVVRVRHVVAECDAAPTGVAAVSLNSHRYASISSMRAISAPSPLRCPVLRMRV